MIGKNAIIFETVLNGMGEMSESQRIIPQKKTMQDVDYIY